MDRDKRKPVLGRTKVRRRRPWQQTAARRWRPGRHPAGSARRKGGCWQRCRCTRSPRCTAKPACASGCSSRSRGSPPPTARGSRTRWRWRRCCTRATGGSASRMPTTRCGSRSGSSAATASPTRRGVRRPAADTVEDHADDLAPGGTRQAALAVLARQFGERTAGLVAAVTNPVYEPGRDEHEQYREHVTASLEACPSARVIKARTSPTTRWACSTPPGRSWPAGQQVPPPGPGAARAHPPPGHPA